MIAAALVVAGFLAGSIPFGLVIGRIFFGVDIRSSGSGNIGTVNALRTLGTAGGAAVLVLDVAKGLLPTLLALRADLPLWTVAATAAATVLGHTFSPWLGGKGGKGVATALGATLAVCWPAGATFALVWLATVAALRFASLGSMAGMLAAAIVLAGATRSAAYAALGLFFTIFVVYTHRENIARLRAGNEHAFKLAR